MTNQTADQSLELLNRVQSLLVDFANENQIDLRAEFGTVDRFKQFVFALTFKTLTDLGLPADAAFDLTAGAGAYDALVEKTWQAAQPAAC